MNRRSVLLLIAAGLCCFDGIASGQKPAGALPDNWLSKAFERARKARRLEGRQVNDVIDAINAHPEGRAKLAGKPNLRQAVVEGVKTATATQKKIDATPGYIGPSAAQAGAVETCNKLGVEYTDLEQVDEKSGD